MSTFIHVPPDDPRSTRFRTEILTTALRIFRTTLLRCRIWDFSGKGVTLSPKVDDPNDAFGHRAKSELAVRDLHKRNFTIRLFVS
ncbi:hypothetical protein CEXT_17121 [Caerostris extrusa]|uniref:Uncharacterized protein n=1 Tax=Caerostris extrusa TaxID=172846 RepID=A0AAV4S0Q8_CAEEX|nr:hypothetical protein CEXT_17121 [Caerostris extrusa]